MSGTGPGATDRARPRPGLLALRATLALGLVGAVVWVAGPAAVVRLLARTGAAGVAAAAAVYGVVVALRAARLELVARHPGLGFGRALRVTAVAQAAAAFLPVRLGELALPVLLERVAGMEYASGIGALLVVRSLDLAALGAWAGAAVALRWGTDRPLLLALCAAAVLPLLLLPVTAAALDRAATVVLAPRGRAGRRWTRHVRRLRRSLAEAAAGRGRLAGAVAASVLLWGGIWAAVGILLDAMGYRWPAGDVLVGAAAGSLATLLPVNLVANLGTLEAGWTAGFVSVGVAAGAAAASGLAVHLWSLLILAVIGAAGAIALPAGTWRRTGG